MRSSVHLYLTLIALVAASPTDAQAASDAHTDAATALASALYDLPQSDQMPSVAEQTRNVASKLRRLNPERSQEIDEFFTGVVSDLRLRCVRGVRQEIAHRLNAGFSLPELGRLSDYLDTPPGAAYFSALRQSTYVSNKVNIVVPDTGDSQGLTEQDRLSLTRFYEILISNEDHWIRTACESGQAIVYEELGIRLQALHLKGADQGRASSADARRLSEARDPRFKRSSKLIANGEFTAATQILLQLVKEDSALAKGELAKIYYRGAGVPVDLTTAFDLFRQAAIAHDIESEHNVGVMYLKGQGIPRDAHAAFEWFMKAAEAGNVPSELAVAESYRVGNGIQKDYNIASSWFERAARHGNAQAAFFLGNLYESGLGVPQDYSRSFELFHQAAELGYAGGQYGVGVAYSFGHGVPRDSVAAINWYMKAAAQGSAAAQFSLGACFANGVGVPKDMATAVIWYLKAANQGHGGAQYNLGFAYGLGQGVPLSLVDAYKWFALSATRPETQKPEAALFNRDHAAAQMTATQLQEAKALKAAWRPTTSRHDQTEVPR